MTSRIVLGVCCLLIGATSFAGELVMIPFESAVYESGVREIRGAMLSGRSGNRPLNLSDRVTSQRQELIQSLKQLQDEYCRASMLDAAIAVRRQIRILERLKEIELPSIPQDPRQLTTSPYELRGRNDEVFYADVTGTVEGSVWGMGPYTDDSNLGTAAVHAGVMRAGETRVVAFRILPGLPAYESSSAHEITTRSYGSYFGSYEILGAGVREENFLRSVRSADAEFTDVYVIGRTTGTVWGSELYTSDSDLGTAAVHAGLVKEGAAGLIRIEQLPGQSSYESSSANGVTTYSYGPWSGTLRLSRVFEN